MSKAQPAMSHPVFISGVCPMLLLISFLVLANLPVSTSLPLLSGGGGLKPKPFKAASFELIRKISLIPVMLVDKMKEKIDRFKEQFSTPIDIDDLFPKHTTTPATTTATRPPRNFRPTLTTTTTIPTA